jgi:hypothetical protein
VRTCELGGIDEDRDDDPVGLAPSQPHQRQMAVMQRAHGRHQRDRLAGGAIAAEPATQRRHIASDGNAFSHGLHVRHDRAPQTRADQGISALARKTSAG